MSIVLINIRWTYFISEADVNQVKKVATLFTTTHHNQIGLFVEPDIDSNYRAVDSTNFTFTNMYAPNLIDPNNNSNVEFFLKDIFFNYLFEKQNYDGSYSDVAGLGNLFSTYMAIETLKIANISYLERKVQLGETDNVANYMLNSLNGGGWGFRFNQYLNDSDIISTFSAIELSYSISEMSIITNKKVEEFINSTWFGGSYRLTNNSLIATPEATFYGVRAFLGMNMSYSLAELFAIGGYLGTLYNPSDGGYRNPETGMSDVQTTYYSISTLDLVENLLGFNLLINESETLNFVLY